MNRQRIVRLERNLPALADKPCGCLLDYRQGQPPPPAEVVCGRCGLLRRGEHTLVEEIVVTTRAEAEAMLKLIEELAP
jgi:hypothetical protein